MSQADSTQKIWLDQKNRRVAIIGAGSLGAALSKRFAACGFRVEVVVSKDLTDASAVADQVGAATYSTALKSISDDIGIIAICVPDDAIGFIADSLKTIINPRTRRIVFHTSGLHASALLNPIANTSTITFSFHPLQTFNRRSTETSFDNIFVGIEGSTKAMVVARRLAELLDVQSFVIKTEHKQLYHLAAVVASNYTVTLNALALEIANIAGIEPSMASAALFPLVRSTVSNLESTTPGDALSGPIVRGDAKTLAKHIKALQKKAPHLLACYAALAGETIRLSVNSGRLSKEAGTSLLDQILDGLAS